MKIKPESHNPPTSENQSISDTASLSCVNDERARWHIKLLTRGGALRASSVLARNGHEVAVFDTGLAQHAASLIGALAVEGLTPNDVTLVFNTHSHVDHSHNNALFKRAQIFCSRRDREWTRGLHEALVSSDHPGPADVLAFYPEMASVEYDPKIVRKVLGIEKLLWDEKCWGEPHQFVWLEEAGLPAGITVIETPGHSPHHVSYVIYTSTRHVLVAGDALLVRNEAHSALQLVPPFNVAAYYRSQALINSFSGIIVPGHDEPFNNSVEIKSHSLT